MEQTESKWYPADCGEIYLGGMEKAGKHGGNMLRILLIEDDTALAMGTEYSLTEEGMAVTCADSFAEVQELWARTEIPFDCVLLDVMLPDTDGFSMCQWLKKQDKSLPVIFVTALSDEGNIVRGLNQGGDDYVTKPFRIRELVARIHANVRKAKQWKTETDNLLTVGKLVIDQDSFTVQKDGRILNLTPREYRLLVELLTHAGQVMTREHLIEHLWSVDEAFVDDNTLSVYIRRLREKLGEDDSTSYIKTVRGVGYKCERGIL